MDMNALGQLATNTMVAEGIKGLINAVISTHIRPLLQKHSDYKDNWAYIEECVSEYTTEIYSKAMIMNTIVFRGTKKSLDDLYIPLTLKSYNEFRDENKNEYTINENLSCVKNNDKILIVDTAGMGKSTIVKYLTVQSIKENAYIPIVIELRKVGSQQGILEYILEQFKLLDKELDRSDLIKMIKRGDFIIFFDGYDEITNENRSGVMENIQNFIEKAGKNKYVITSREDDDLSCLGDFERFFIKPLEVKEAYDLIKKYDKNGEKSKALIHRIETDRQFDELKEFLVNPMLVSLLYKTFEYKEEIPYKKLAFYSQAYEALFNDHDKTKGGAYVHPKKTNLDIYDFEKLLRRIAFISLKKNQVSYSRENLFEIIEKSLKDMSWVSTSVVNVIHDLINAVPLFQKDGSEYRWIHKSFMEYFAACFICYDKGNIINTLKSMVSSKKIDKYKNVLDFCFDIKPDVAREIIVYEYICSYINFYENSYTSSIFENYDSELIDFRRTVAFSFRFVISGIRNRESSDFIRKKMEDYEKMDYCLWGVYSFACGNAIMVFYNKNYYINTLLQMKEYNIFKKNRISKEERKYIGNSKYLKDMEVTENEEDKTNRTENEFIYITRMMMSFLNNIPYLDYKKCKNLKTQIEQEIKERNALEKEFEL